MTDFKTTVDLELTAIQILTTTLEPLDADARSRIVNYVVDRLDIALRNVSESEDIRGDYNKLSDKRDTDKQAVNTTHSTFAELFEAARPKLNSDKALIAGYWIQVCQGADGFTGRMANTELKHLGYGLSNITDSIGRLGNRKPALVLQIKKSGKSRQARKVYKVTDAGVKVVRGMIDAQ